MRGGGSRATSLAAANRLSQLGQMTPDEFAKTFGPEAAKAAQDMTARVMQAQELSIVTHLAMICLFSGYEPGDEELRQWIATFCPEDGQERHDRIMGKIRETTRTARELADYGALQRGDSTPH